MHLAPHMLLYANQSERPLKAKMRPFSNRLDDAKPILAWCNLIVTKKPTTDGATMQCNTQFVHIAIVA